MSVPFSLLLYHVFTIFASCSLDGVEVRLINALASKMNFSAVFAWPSDGSNWGYVRVNGTLSGMIGTSCCHWLPTCAVPYHHGTVRRQAAGWPVDSEALNVLSEQSRAGEGRRLHTWGLGGGGGGSGGLGNCRYKIIIPNVVLHQNQLIGMTKYVVCNVRRLRE